MSEKDLNLFARDSNKGDNGKVLIVGGSRLFHAASLWSAKVAAHFVDMVFYASTRENNQLVKSLFTDGIVVGREDIIDYAAEADVILVGPGMERVQKNPDLLEKICQNEQLLSTEILQTDTYIVTNWLLRRFPDKKFVLDAGALQMLEVANVTAGCILTPHEGEWELLQRQARESGSENLEQCTLLLKGTVDKVVRAGQTLATIEGGNPGLTKGGSGDVLAGVVAGLYANNPAETACWFASRGVKTAGDKLAETYGPFFTTTQLAEQVAAAVYEAAK